MAKRDIQLKSGLAHPSPQPLHTGTNDEAEWFGQDASYMIDFLGNSPFQGTDRFEVKKGKSVSRALKANVKQGLYHYDLVRASAWPAWKKSRAKAMAAGLGQDPDVEILP